MGRLAACAAALLIISSAVAAAADAPPAATVATGGRTITMTRGTYCWGTQCVDMIPPAQRADIVRLRVAKGALLSIHLGFSSSTWNARILGGAPRSFAPGSRATWRVLRAGTLEVEARGPKGSASYLVRLVLR